MVKWRGLPTKDINGCLYVKLDDVRELDEQLWAHLEARIAELDAKLGEASDERKYQQIFGQIRELIDLKGFIIRAGAGRNEPVYGAILVTILVINNRAKK